MSDFVVLGTSYYTKMCAKGIIDSGHNVVAIVAMSTHLVPNNSFNLANFAREQGCNYLEVDDINSPIAVSYIKKCAPDYIFVSWPKILKSEVIELARKGCIGTHPTNLPENRGRHPLHWLICLGYEETVLSFFALDKGVDTGDILHREPIQLPNTAGVQTAYENMNQAGYLGMKQLGKLLHAGELPTIKQDHVKANYWRKREPIDCVIDFRMSVNAIVRLVRSYAEPYPLASVIIQDRIIKVKEAKQLAVELFPDMMKYEQGFILDISRTSMIVKCDDGIVELVTRDAIPEDFFTTKYIFPPGKYIYKDPTLFLELT